MGRSPKSDIYIDGEKIYVYIGSAQIWAVSAFLAVGSLKSGIWLVNGPFNYTGRESLGRPSPGRLRSQLPPYVGCHVCMSVSVDNHTDIQT